MLSGQTRSVFLSDSISAVQGLGDTNYVRLPQFGWTAHILRIVCDAEAFLKERAPRFIFFEVIKKTWPILLSTEKSRL